MATISPQRLAELRMMPYAEYLKTPEWLLTRKRILQRDHSTCQGCQAQKVRLHVHHYTYARLGCEDDEDLVTLCEVCHDELHRQLAEVPRLSFAQMAGIGLGVATVGTIGVEGFLQAPLPAEIGVLIGNLQYVPVMRANTDLLIINPLLASGFTIFSLIYSVVAEFFGTKLPTIEELQARKHYLEETATVIESIQQLEQKTKSKSLITTLKEKAIEGKTAWKEVTQSEDLEETKPEEPDEEMDGQEERNTDELETGTGEETTTDHEQKFEGTEEATILVNQYPKTASWLTDGRPTVALKMVSETMSLSMKMLNNRVAKRQIRATKNKSIVYKSSLIKWAMEEIIPEESKKIVHLNAARKEADARAESTEQLPDDQLERTLKALANNPDITDEMLAEMLGLTRPASARFWRVKALEMMKNREAISM